MRKLLDKLQEYQGALKIVRIERPFPGNYYINGFIHYTTESLMLMHQFHDFYCEGFTIVKTSDIKDFRSSEYERFLEKVMNGEGLLEQIKYDHSVPLDDIKSSLSHFMNNQQNIIIECESRKNADDDEFYIGRVSEIDGETVWFMGFNALGQWEKDEISIKLDTITQIQFDTPYINILTRYVT